MKLDGTHLVVEVGEATHEGVPESIELWGVSGLLGEEVTDVIFAHYPNLLQASNN